MASNSLQHYTKTSVIDCKINDASDSENKVNHSDLDDAENVPEEVTKCSSSSKRTALARKVRLRSSSDEEESDLNPSKTAKESPLAVQIISDSTDSEMEHSNSDDDHNMAQRRKKRKTRTLSDDESNKSSDLESKQEDPSGSFINENAESQETVQSSNSSDLVDEEGSIGSFIVEDSQTQEIDASAGPVVRDGDFIASKEVNENNSHNLYQVVGTNLNFFMMLKNRRKFIATGEYLIITEDMLEDCTGPIPVKPCASVEDHTVVEIDDKLNNICSLIAKNHGLKPLQLEASKRLNKQGARDLRTPSLEEAHKRFVQMILSGIVDSEFSTSLEVDRVPYFDKAKEVVIKELNNGKKMVDSTAWNKEFKKMLNSCPLLKRKDLPYMIQRATCQACQLTRNLTERLLFYQQHDGEKVKPAVKKFSVGCYCADRANTYHDLQHYDFELRQSCVEKLEKLRAMPGQETGKEEDVVIRCLDDKDWLEILFKAFQAHLKNAQKWATDGNKRKEMEAHCSSFR